jgi:hypothetical protein
MNKNLTEIVAILDRSGSMESLTGDTIGGYNSFVEGQKNVPGEAILTTVLFDDHYDLLHDRINIKGVRPITDKEYFARGMTALLDAIGRTIDGIGLKLHNIPEAERPGKVIFFIITDGYENASKKYSHRQIKDKIELQKNVYNWEFIFLGANIDSEDVAESIGISSNMAFDFDADSAGMRSVTSGMCRAAMACRIEGFDRIDEENLRMTIKNSKKKQPLEET